jgi:uncharacterized protein YbjT (DUF2867 family)
MTAVVIGATGLIGSHLVNQLRADPFFDRVRLLLRKWEGPSDSRLEIVEVNFQDLPSLEKAIGEGDIVFCAIGTTMKKVKGDKTAYRKIDYDIPVNVATISQRRGYKKFLLVSAVSANSKSSNFYLKLKGEVEDSLKGSGFESMHIFRPSLLLGKRNEKRPGESLAQLLGPLFSFLLLGSLSKYKPVKASDVAKAMIAASKTTQKGCIVHEYDSIMKLIHVAA